MEEPKVIHCISGFFLLSCNAVITMIDAHMVNISIGSEFVHYRQVLMWPFSPDKM